MASKHSAVNVDGRIALESKLYALAPGDLVLAEQPLMSVPPVPDNSPLAIAFKQHGLDPALSIQAIAATIQYFSADHEVQLSVSPLQRFDMETIAAHPLASALHDTCDALKGLNLLTSTAAPAVFERVFYCFDLHGCKASDGSLCLFDIGSKMRHSCRPNSKHSGNGEIRALCKINNGDELFVSYLDDDTLMLPTLYRQDNLQDNWMTDCDCERCTADVDIFRGHRCGVPNCDGPIWPPSLPALEWCCSACGKVYKKLNEQLNSEAETTFLEHLPWLENVGEGPVSALLSHVSYDQLRDILRSDLALALHSTHWLISLLHLMCGLMCLSGEEQRSRAAVVHFKVRSDALKAMFGDAVMQAQASVWQYRGDAACGNDGLEEALHCYEASWKLTIVLWGKDHQQTKLIRRKVKKTRKQLAQAKGAAAEGTEAAQKTVAAAGETPHDSVLHIVTKKEPAAPVAGQNITFDPLSPSRCQSQAQSIINSPYDIEDGERSPGGTLQFATGNLFDSDDEALLLDDSSDYGSDQSCD